MRVPIPNPPADAGDRLYHSSGWTEIGSAPDHAFRPDGRLAETTLFYKKLG